MTPRPFICTPSAWISDPVLNGLSDDSEALFRRLCSCTDARWRFALDPSQPEHTIRTACFAPQRRFRAWNPNRIRAALNELTASGMLIRHFQGHRHWIEVAEMMRYEKGRDPFGVEPPAQQVDLPNLGPSLFAMPSPEPSRVVRAAPERVEARKVDAPLRERAAIGMRVEKEEEENNSSNRARPQAAGNAETNDDDERGVVELEGELRAMGVNIESEDRNWRRRCERMGWSLDDESWRRWLSQALKRRPRVKKAPSATSKKCVPKPPEWDAFVASEYPKADGDSWANAQSIPHVLKHFAEWTNQTKASA
jgi:hypothetical protein